MKITVKQEKSVKNGRKESDRKLRKIKENKRQKKK